VQKSVAKVLTFRITHTPARVISQFVGNPVLVNLDYSAASSTSHTVTRAAMVGYCGVVRLC
jgi:hypothetical protein